ncbi:Cof-type HAD-IIB family hydrolase [Dysgonomonas sp. 511]|uniref:Cof-type HAD-IIB family hydrolase n=1 Tax=Dysgonomonas sp. 511 TaxID=2302930 RepID=UPI0013D64E9F|nr:Cof-type HAD-IIB family hydrolase [Dysgonomonas sp. 511]NDV78678.1 Cof-type HAD-IIB family hydrolase [Dysgonomonas sp. 511]
MNIQAIFFDIDGTFVSFETHKIPLSALEAVEKLKQKNIKLIIATGRSLHDINNLDDLVFDGYITANGAYCVTSDKHVLHKNLISKEDLCRLAIYQRDNKFPCIFMTEKGNFANYINDSVKAINNMVNLPLPTVKSMEEIIKYDVFQIDTFVNEDEEKVLIENILIGCEGSRWHPSFVDINARGNNKAVGIEVFLKHYDISRKNTMAFGDGGNDIPMLEYVAIGVAMGNANDQVKRAADYVTSSVDDGGIMMALIENRIL